LRLLEACIVSGLAFVRRRNGSAITAKGPLLWQHEKASQEDGWERRKVVLVV